MAISTKSELITAVKTFAANPDNQLKYQGGTTYNYDYINSDLYMAGANTHFTDVEINEVFEELFDLTKYPYIPSYEYSDFS